MVVGRKPWAAASVLVVATAAALAGCGTSATGPGVTKVDTVPVFSPYSGTMANNLGVTNFYAATEVEVGDLDATHPNETERGVVTFFVQNLEGDSVTSAVLRLDECFVGGAPFNTLGTIQVERLFPIGTPPAGYQDLGPGFFPGNLTSSPDTGFVYVPVTTAVGSDLADSAVFSQFRLRFTNADGNNNGISDFVDFNGGPQAQAGNCVSNTAGEPLLLITVH